MYFKLAIFYHDNISARFSKSKVLENGCSQALCAVGPHTASKLRPLRPYVSLPSPHTAIAVAGRDWPQRTVHRTQP